MTCAKIGITIFAAFVLIFTFWPDLVNEGLSKSIIIISALFVILITWVGTECKWCKDLPKQKAKRRR